MTATNHALTGALVASAISSPKYALPAAILSHFLLDTVPHWNYGVPPKYLKLTVVLDCLLGFSLLLLFVLVSKTSPWLIMTGGFLGVLPDFMWLPNILKGKPSPMNENNWFHKLRRFHAAIQWSETAKGFWVELLWLFCSVILILLIG